MHTAIANYNPDNHERDKVRELIPDFLRENATNLITFLEEYYDYLNRENYASYELGHIIDENDIDLTSAKYLDAIQGEIAKTVQNSAVVDRNTLYKRIIHYYRIKGTPDSVSVFFQIMFDSLVDVYYPGDHLFKLSEGKYDAGSYSNERGFLSSTDKIHDGEFWQDFSYQIRTTIDESRWKDSYHRLVHPAGIRFFSLLLIDIVVKNRWEDIETYKDTVENPDGFYDSLIPPRLRETNSYDASHTPKYQPGWLSSALAIFIESLADGRSFDSPSGEPIVSSNTSLKARFQFEPTNFRSKTLHDGYLTGEGRYNPLFWQDGRELRDLGYINSTLIALTSNFNEHPLGTTPVNLSAGTFTTHHNTDTVTILVQTSLIAADGTVTYYPLASFPSYGVIPEDWQEDEDITGVTIGRGITVIDDNAFDGCEDVVGNLEIPSSVAVIGKSAFFGWNATGTLTLHEGLQEIDDNAFEQTAFQGNLVIPNSVTFIGEEAFRDFASTGTLTLGSGVTSIDKKTFKGSAFTGALVIPVSVTEIKKEAFEDCEYFTSLELNEGLLIIRSEAFEDCKRMAGTLTLPNSLTMIDEDAFHGCNGFTGALVIPDNVTEIDDGAFSDCSGFNGTLTIGSGLTDPAKFEKGIFSNCSGFTGVTISSGVTIIPERTFYNCTSLASASIPDSVTSLGDYAFYNCTSLTSVAIPSSVTSIGNSAFGSCTSLTSVTIPEGVTSIGGVSFGSCTSLTSLIIPSTITDFSAGYQFYNCTSLTTITCHLTESFFNSTSALAGSNVTAMTVDSGKGWSAGSQTVAGKTGVTVTIA